MTLACKAISCRTNRKSQPPSSGGCGFLNHRGKTARPMVKETKGNGLCGLINDHCKKKKLPYLGNVYNKAHILLVRLPKGAAFPSAGFHQFF